MPRSLTCPTFVGRSDELARLDAALQRVRDGESVTVLLGGDAGVGKTRLLTEFLTGAAAGKAHVLLGRCMELGEGGLPFAPVRQALRGLAHRLPPERLVALAGAGRADLARLLPELGDAEHSVVPTDPAPDASLQLRLFEHVLDLLVRLGEHGPLVLALEDVHWSDRSTRDLFAFLAHSLGQARVLLIASYRTDELTRTHPLRPLLARLARIATVERIPVASFDRPELVELLTGLLGEAPRTELLDEVYRRSEGNAFFAEELAAAACMPNCELPDTLRELLLARFEALPQDTRQVLRVAAAAGRAVDHELLSTVADLPEPELLAALRTAVGDQLLVTQPDTLSYAFRHALLQEAVHDDLLPGERTALHGALARVIERRPELSGAADPAGAIAWHWFAAHDQPRALAAALTAAEAAEAVFAFAEAQRHLERALELWEAVPDAEQHAGTDHVGLLKFAAGNAQRASDHQRAVALARTALSLVDERAEPRRAGLLHQLLARALGHAGLPGVDVALEAAVRLVPSEPPSSARARVLVAAGTWHMVTARYEPARRLSEEAVRVARAAGAVEEEVHARITLGCALDGLGDADAGIAELEEARRAAEETGDIPAQHRVATNLSDVLGGNGALEEAVAVALGGLALAERYGLGRSYAAFPLNNASEFLLALGRWDEAAALLRRAQAWESRNITGMHNLVLRANLAVWRGDLETARAVLEPIQQHRSAETEAQFSGPIAEARAALALLEGRVEDARAIALAGLEALQRAEGRRRYGGRLYWLAAVAGADALALLRRDLARPAGTTPEFRAYAQLAEAEWSQSEPEAWAAAAATFDELSEPFPAAQARLRHAQALLAAGSDRDLARTALQAAVDTACSLGAEPLRAQCEQLARRGRLDLDDRAAPADTAFGLTARETEVLRLVAAGRSNREIGEALFISGKTASVHVSNILAKLAVASRGEAAALAYQLGLADATPSGAPVRAS